MNKARKRKGKEMQELTKKEAYQYVSSDVGKVALYVYSPLCGTCKVATTMMETIEKMLPSLHIAKCNINTIPMLAQDLKIKSVPYLAIVQNGHIHQEIYAFRSIPFLFDTLKKQVIE